MLISIRPVLVTGPVLLVALTAWGFVARGPVFGVIALVCVGLSLIPVSLRGVPHLPSSFATGWIGLLVAHVALGMGLSLYETMPSYDDAIHLVAFVWIGRLLSECARDWECRARVRLPGAPLLVLLVALGLGASWELVEFSIDQLGVVVTQPSLHDTMMDFVWDAVGTLLALTPNIVRGSASFWPKNMLPGAVFSGRNHELPFR